MEDAAARKMQAAAAALESRTTSSSAESIQRKATYACSNACSCFAYFNRK